MFNFPNQPFAGKPDLVVGDLYELTPVITEPVYAYTFEFTQ